MPALPAMVPLAALVTPPAKEIVPSMRMPACAALITPALLMPPVKVCPVIAIAILVETIVLALSMPIPTLEARILPLSTIAPLMVEPAIVMPVLALIVPELEILPAVNV